MTKQEVCLRSMAQLFRILGDPSRLRILFALQEGESNVTELCKRLKLRQPTVSHHLGILRMGGVVNNRRNGKEIIYGLRNLVGEQYGRAVRAALKNGRALCLGSLVLALTQC